MKKRINLNDCRKKNSKVLSGREEGYGYRKKFKIDTIDEEESSVEVIVPDDLYSINISFFLGLFGESIRKLGEKRFREKYEFLCDEFILENINDGIKKATRVSNVLRN